jgi:hypothetical protein
MLRRLWIRDRPSYSDFSERAPWALVTGAVPFKFTTADSPGWFRGNLWWFKHHW